MAHIGLTPQSVNALGGYRVQGRGDEAAHRLLQDAKAMQHAGAFAVVLEVVPSDLAAQVTDGAAHPDHRHRRRPGLRRPGARLAGHGGAARRGKPAKFVKEFAQVGAVLRTAAEALRGRGARAAATRPPEHEYS